MRRILWSQSSRQGSVKPKLKSCSPILFQRRFVFTEVPTIIQNTSSLTPLVNDRLHSVLENDITIGKLSEIIEEDDQVDILADKNSVLGQIMVQKCEYEMGRLLNGEIDRFDEVMEFLIKLKSIAQYNKNLRTMFDDGISNDYLLQVIEKPFTLTSIFNNELKSILNTGNDQTKVERILNLMKLNKLLVHKLNPMKSYRVEIYNSFTSQISKLMIQDNKHYEFFQQLINSNASNTISCYHLAPLRKKLIFGSEREKHLIYFYEIFEDIDNEQLKSKYVKLYSFELLRQILIHHIKKNDTIRSKIYMDLLISRYAIEQGSEEDGPQISNSAKLDKLYSSIMYFSTSLGNYKHSLSILKKISEMGHGLSPRLCHVILTSLRKKKMYDGGLEILRILPKVLKDNASFDEKAKLAFVNELLTLLREKFNDPKLVLAHLVTIFPHSVELLNDLELLNPIVRGQKGRLEDLSYLKKAVLDDFYVFEDESVYLTNFNVTQLYMTLLNHLSKSFEHNLFSVEFTANLFNSFMKVAKRVQLEELTNPELKKNHPFSSENLDEAILNIFMRRMLEDFRLSKSALSMAKRFLTQLKYKRFNADKLGYLFYQHPQFIGNSYDAMITILNHFQVELSFQVIVGNIFKCYNRGEHNLSKRWYEALRHQSFPLTNRKLIKFIHKQGWEFPDNFNYKLLDYLELPKHESAVLDDFSVYNDTDEPLEIYDKEFVQELIKELVELSKNSSKV